MATGQKQKMKQEQQLSPQQMMVMKLLQMPITSLEQTVQEAIEKNPMLEMDDNVNDNEILKQVQDDEGGMDGEGNDNVDDDDDDNDDDNEDKFSEGFGSEEDDEDYLYKERQEYDPNMREQNSQMASSNSPVENLLEQMRMLNLSEKEWTIGEVLIGSLDASGYLSRSVEVLSNDMFFRPGIETTPDEVEAVLHKLQSLDPAGIGARNLQECLSLQLHRIEKHTLATRCAMEIVDNHFEDYSKQRYNKIKELLEIDDETLTEADSVIKSLDPRPGSSDSDSDSGAHCIIPDFVVGVLDGRPILSLNIGTLEGLHLSTDYLAMMAELQQQKQMSKEDRSALQFLKENHDSAQAFIDALQSRQSTMTDIMKAILSAQSQFFVTGDRSDLKPLRQKDIAQQTGYDESTVSRMVNSKYVQTEWGTLSLADCFSNAVTTESGEEIASEKIRQELKKIVDGEDKSHPMNDDALVAALKERGFSVARRTVAKYRKMLGILPTQMRKGLKTLLLVLMVAGGSALWAQAPMSYYDSLIYQQTHAPKQVSVEAKADVDDSPKEAKKRKKASKGQQQQVPQVKSVLDSILSEGDELIDQIYNESLPSPLWYGNEFSGSRVRLRSFDNDSLPDEVNIHLVKEDVEFCFPIKNIITSPYGWRWNRPHRGVDIRLNTGDAVHCAFNGVVRIARPMGAYGNLVVVRHYNGLETVYGHLSKIKVTPKQEVKAGDVLGLGGSTGRSTGPHLHFEVRFQYEPFDPEWILDFQGYTLRTHKLHLDKSYFGIRKPRNGDGQEYKADKSYVKEQERIVKKERYYTTVEGDYSELIALRYGITVQQLRDLNPGLKKVQAGMRLRVR